jgi:hypothetical protein
MLPPGDDLGKPAAANLAARLDEWGNQWPAVLDATRFSGETGPRVLVGRGVAGDLAGLRRLLGDAIAGVKAAHPVVPATGTLVDRGLE